MADWNLTRLLEGLHDEIQNGLEISRRSFAHPSTKGDGSEGVWLKMFNSYLPQRYEAKKAHVVDSLGHFSEQIDVVIFDRQYSPFIFTYQDQIIIPAESVYAVFESKQAINAQQVQYAQEKIASVRRLHRTSLPIPHAGGVYPPKPAIPIYGGLLTFESDWKPGLGEPLMKALQGDQGDGRLNLGCVAAHGHFSLQRNASDYTIYTGGKPATAFLFNLISELQYSGTVPMIDVLAYSRWLTL